MVREQTAVATRDNADKVTDVPMAQVRTTCPYCGVGCGLLAFVEGDASVTIKGDPEHPANFGRLCSKGAALGETLGPEGRLLQPEIAGRTATWDEALDLTAAGFRDAIVKHGPNSVAFYVSGQLLTEDYYVANKLMKGFIGSGNIDTNSRLCMASAVAAQKRAFGSDTVPCDYTDLEQADLVLIIGSNLAWCHPVLYQRLLAAKTSNAAMRVVVVDPRRTATAEIADLYLPIKPGRDGFLLSWLLAELDRLGCRDDEFIDAHTDGFDQTLDAARRHAGNIDAVGSETDLDPEALLQLRDWIRTNRRMVTLFSQGINQSSSGTDKGNAIINLHLLTGRIGKPGMGPFSITGQPNAMGGREVGGLANQLAAHIDFADAAGVDLVRRFWGAPNLATEAGLKAVDLFQAVREGKIKALLIMATNPLVSLPDIGALKENLPDDLFVAVADCIRDTPTSAIADVLLPAAAWGEKAGTVTNSERRVSRQRPFLPLPGKAKPDWWILSELGRRLGHGQAFDYASPAEIFREHAALARAVDRDLDFGDPEAINDETYETWQPVAWPVAADRRLFADGRFFAENGKARFVPITPSSPKFAPDDHLPFVLNTGRYRDHWHTLTRTARSTTLSRHRVEPLVEVNPADALALELVDGGFAEVASAQGSAILRVSLDAGQQQGCLFVPMHWSGAHNQGAAVNRLVAPTVDPVSGQPESKASPVRIRPCHYHHVGFLLTRSPISLDDLEYSNRSRVEGGWRHDFATDLDIKDWQDWLALRLGRNVESGSWMRYSDGASNHHRLALIIDDRLEAVLIIGGQTAKDWLADRLAEPVLDERTRMSLLAGEIPGADPGPLVCACFGIGQHVIQDAIDRQGLGSTDLIGSALKAGTNCGSCLPELRSLIKKAALSQNRVSSQSATSATTADVDLMEV